MLLRLLIFLGVVLLIFLPFNWLTVRQLLRIHPRRRLWIIGAAVAGNLMWPFLTLLRSSTDFSRATRAILGPVWFGWTSFALLYSLFLFLVLIAWALFARRRKFAELARWPSRVFLVFIIVGFAVGCWQALVPLRVERVTIRVPKLQQPVRLALMGDLHVGLFTRPSRLEKIFATASAERPDALLIAGDLIDDDPYFVPKLLAGTRALAPEIPLFGVLGNHEMYGDPARVVEGLRGSRMRLLVNEGVPLRGLWIAGVSDPAARDVPDAKRYTPDLRRALAGRPASSVPLVLAHQPKILDEARRLGVPVALSAHTHGGQLGFRPLRVSLAGVFLPYHMGLYDIPPTQLYINTGTGYWLFPFRLGMTPEITIIELRP
ncbi:MAG TPA: metallophosphoesterase [Thermoanaerobaculia bacterium]|nr:metallophosphoesterase [Thermoanaerobaculia bacterium]